MCILSDGADLYDDLPGDCNAPVANLRMKNNVIEASIAYSLQAHGSLGKLKTTNNVMDNVIDDDMDDVMDDDMDDVIDAMS